MANMSQLNDHIVKNLIEKYGPKIRLESKKPAIAEVLKEIGTELSKKDPKLECASYNKTYTEGYIKEDYDKADYVKYEKTYVKTDEEQIKNQSKIDKEADQLIIEKIRSNINK